VQAASHGGAGVTAIAMVVNKPSMIIMEKTAERNFIFLPKNSLPVMKLMSFVL